MLKKGKFKGCVPLIKNLRTHTSVCVCVWDEDVDFNT